MSELIWWYIQIIGWAYLEAGLTIAGLGFIINLIYPSSEQLTWKNFLTIILFHPIVIYYFIKEYYGNR